MACRSAAVHRFEVQGHRRAHEGQPTGCSFAIGRGGLAVIQDPDEALFPSMPQSVREHVGVDRVVGIRDLAHTLCELMDEPLPEREPPVTQSDAMENNFAAGSLDAMAADTQHPGKVSAYGCPDCGGVLWELKDEEFTRFRCRVGHAWTSDALLAQQADTLDQALWVALRALEESAALFRSDCLRSRNSARVVPFGPLL